MTAFSFVLVLLFNPKIPSAHEVMTLDTSMLRFLETHVNAGDPSQRFAQLKKAVFKKEALGLTYEANPTNTAALTFAKGSANCLSFSILFVALAREAGLEAYFQEVETPPSRYKKSSFVTRERHINAVVKIGGKLLEVDFNRTQNKRLHRQVVDDTRALAQFYNNRGVERLARQEIQSAMDYFQEGLTHDRDLPYLWTNLGVVYRYRDNQKQAEQAFLTALALEEEDPTAMVNMAELFAARGDHAVADWYFKKLQRRQGDNPYFHQRLGNQAFRMGNHRKALEHYRIAANLKRDEPDFHLALARIYRKLGMNNKARNALRNARAYTTTPFSPRTAQMDELQ